MPGDMALHFAEGAAFANDADSHLISKYIEKYFCRSP
jgi:hypothetical protein